MILETIIVGPMEVNCYVLALNDGENCLIIDPGAEERKIKKIITSHNFKPECIINTHGHFDHIGCDDKFGVSVYAHKLDVPMLKSSTLNLSGLFSLPYQVSSEIIPLEDEDTVKTKDFELEVIHLPGHTPGGIALYVKKPHSNVIFTGDSLFYKSIGRTDLVDGNEEALINSIKEKLFCLPDDTIVYPGHGPSSTIGEEKSNNAFLR